MFTFYKKCSIINIVLRGILDINNMREREREYLWILGKRKNFLSLGEQKQTVGLLGFIFLTVG